MKKSLLVFSIFSISVLLVPFIKAENLDPPCPQGKGKWFCYGFRLANLFDLGATIAACATENGSIPKSEVAEFAVDYTLNKFSSGDRRKVETDLYKMIQDDSDFRIQKRVEANINNSGGCAVVLSRYYPGFSKARSKPPGSLRDTMSDTPFQW